MGVDLPAEAAGVRPCGLDGRLHRGLFAWHPGLNPTRKPREPCLWSRLSGRPKVSLLHSACGSRPTSRSCGRPSLWIGRSTAPWLIRMAPGPQPDAQAAWALHVEPALGSTQGEPPTSALACGNLAPTRGHCRLGTYGCNGSCAVKGCLIDKYAFPKKRLSGRPKVPVSYRAGVG